jgi:WD40 repeat protein
MFLFNQCSDSARNGLSPFNQIFLLTELHSKILLKSTISETSEINSVAISPDGQTIVSRSKDNTIKVRNLKTGNLISTIAGNPDEQRKVLISPDGQTVTSSGKDGIQIWNLKTGLLKTSLPYAGKQGVEGLCF